MIITSCLILYYFSVFVDKMPCSIEIRRLSRVLVNSQSVNSMKWRPLILVRNLESSTMLYLMGIRLLLNCCFVCVEGYSSSIYQALSIWQPLYNLLYSARFFLKVANGLFFCQRHNKLQEKF